MSDNNVTPMPGTRTQEVRIAELEAALGKAQSVAAGRGRVEQFLIEWLGPSYSTTIAGLFTGAVALTPLIPADAPHWMHVAGTLATAIGIAYLGKAAKATSVTGVK
jgi:hypothetical protein